MTTVARKSEAVLYDEKTYAISAYGPARSTIKGTPLTADKLRKIDAHWRAGLYLCIGMLYLKEKPIAA
jgi:xylulose-5-phosphate/fructose-6-phosphate phosphoketolase